MNTKQEQKKNIIIFSLLRLGTSQPDTFGQVPNLGHDGRIVLRQLHDRRLITSVEDLTHLIQALLTAKATVNYYAANYHLDTYHFNTGSVPPPDGCGTGSIRTPCPVLTSITVQTDS